ncbi:MAG: heme-binding protein, partial [Lentisphaeraceae bacterium]|nr:heme-binding protein [Lentisphaeraceae bacterium]
MKYLYLLITGFLVLVEQNAAAAPQWIWSTEANSQKIEFNSTLKLKVRRVRDAIFKVACDQGAKVFINGKLVATNESWDKPIAVDVRRALKKNGISTVRIEANKASGENGLLFTLQVNGKIKLQSDASWKTKINGKIAAVKILREYGAQPQGNVLEKAVQNEKAQATNIDTIKLPAGFSADLLYSVPGTTQGSWVGMTVDDQGRLITCDQYGGLYRVDIKDEIKVTKLKAKIYGAHGIIYAFGSLYAMVTEGRGNNGLYRFRDSNGDGEFDKKEFLQHFEASGEHGLHSLALSPDKKSLYIVCGNHSKLPASLKKSRAAKAWSEDHLLPRMWDARGHAKGVLAPGGFVIKCDPDGTDMELISYGFRNPFDIAFTAQGELFTYDADLEFDFGSPWYRP